MSAQGKKAAPLAGWRWGPFTFRLPFYHTRLHWPEFLQGIALASATGLALVPFMMTYFDLSFEQAIAMSFMHGFLIGIAPIAFGEPYSPGWLTPALPLVMAFVITGYDTPVERLQAMTAMTMVFTVMLAILGATGLGRKLMEWLPAALKAGIIMGAGIAAFQRVFLDGDSSLADQPISTVIACSVALVLLFSIPFRFLKLRARPLMVIGGLGLLPGFLAAAFFGPLFGEVEYNIRWEFFVPPVVETWQVVSPFAIGWPSWEMYLAAAPLALITYIILFGDLVTGNEIIEEAQKERPDDPIEIDTTRSHLSLAIRNLLMGISAPFFTTQGPLWAGVHVTVVQRWRQGRRTMSNLFSGVHSYYFMGIPFIYFVLPLLTALEPLMGVALSLTLVLTGFACAYVAMAIPAHPVERGVTVLTGVALAFFEPWQGLAVGVVAAVLLIGGRDAVQMERAVSEQEQSYHKARSDAADKREQSRR